LFCGGSLKKTDGHQLCYTPSYHCELQPIEGVWAVVKGELARTAPHANLLEIRNKLLDAFKEKVTSTTIVGLCKRSLTKAKEYRDMNDDMFFLKCMGKAPRCFITCTSVNLDNKILI
jgi:hypothetical protein